MAALPPEILLFDLGGVLIENAIFDDLPTLMPRPVEGDELRRRWLDSPSVQAYERGRMATEDFGQAFVAEWGLELAPGAFLERFTAWPRGPYPGALELLDRLAGDYRLAILSNSNPLHWDLVEPFRRRVEAAFSSHLLGAVKPEAEAFHQVAQALKAEPSAIWFFDDSLPNIDAARAVGMGASLARGVEDIERTLLDLRSA